MVAARYLAALLCEDGAPGTEGAIVTQVAVQQRDFGQPLDDVIVDCRRRDGQTGRLSLRAKRSLIISAAASNADFREIIRACLKTLLKANFREDVDRFGAATGSVAAGKFDILTSLCELARASVTLDHFESRFAASGNASDELRSVHDVIATLLSDEPAMECHTAWMRQIAFGRLGWGGVSSALHAQG